MHFCEIRIASLLGWEGPGLLHGRVGRGGASGTACFGWIGLGWRFAMLSHRGLRTFAKELESIVEVTVVAPTLAEPRADHI